MNEIKIFESPEFGKVRTAEINGEPYFIGKDVAEILGYTNPRDALANHVENEDKATVAIYDGSQNRNVTGINESGLYSLIFGSKMPKAREFKHWVTSEVLPTIRKTGGYVNNDDLFTETYLPFADENTKNLFKLQLSVIRQLNSKVELLTADNETMKPKAEYFDELVDRNLLTSLRDTAKELHIKEREFIQFLIDKKYLYRDAKNILKPYATRSELFNIKEYNSRYSNHSGVQTMVTPKGRETFRLLLKNGA